MKQLLQQQEIIIQVRQAVGLLPMGQRQAITLVDLEGFSYEEVAAILSIPIGTVMSRLSRGRISLKESLLKYNMSPKKSNSPKIKLRSVK